MRAFHLRCSRRISMKLRFADEGPRECAERLARDKALTVWRTRPQDLVLGADTIVVVEGAILGKPADADDATRMLRMLSGRSMSDHRGVSVAGRPAAVGN